MGREVSSELTKTWGNFFLQASRSFLYTAQGPQKQPEIFKIQLLIFYKISLKSRYIPIIFQYIPFKRALYNPLNEYWSSYLHKIHFRNDENFVLSMFEPTYSVPGQVKTTSSEKACSLFCMCFYPQTASAGCMRTVSRILRLFRWTHSYRQKMI